MSEITNHSLYLEDIEKIIDSPLEWEKLKRKSFLISGATGMIGSLFCDALFALNKKKNIDCQIIALSRDKDKAQDRFEKCIKEDCFSFIEADINEDITKKISANVDYVVHLASNTHPIAYASDPIGTISTNIIGTKNLLDLAVEKKCKRILFASSNEIYGENRGDTELFAEDYLGYIDCNTLRAGYPESKRCGEALCQAYISAKGVDIVIPRITRSFGPTLLSSDTKALSQFLHKAIAGENIVLKSDGMQYYSYIYVADVVTGLFTMLIRGKCGEAYNIADESCDIGLKALAEMVAKIAGTNVIFDLPEETEAAGFSKATKARLDGSKLTALGWKPRYSLEEGIDRTLKILKEMYRNE